MASGFTSDMKKADVRRKWTNRRFHTEFTEVLHAGRVKGQLQCVVRDTSGLLWLCREETVHTGTYLGPESLWQNGAPISFLMPFYGPCPDPIEELPLGYHPETTALLAQASSLIKRGRIAA